MRIYSFRSLQISNTIRTSYTLLGSNSKSSHPLLKTQGKKKEGTERAFNIV